MAISNNLISGLSSGIDWRTMVDQLIAIDHRRVDLISNKKNENHTKLKEWQLFNTKLLTLKSASEALNTSAKFKIFTADMATNSSTVKASDLLSVSTGETASPGSYNIKVTNLAQAQKLSSNPFTSQSSALGSSYAGNIVINGKVITINATDTLADVAASINKVNTGATPSGVTASVVNFGTNDYRLILTNDTTGAKGISLLNGSTTNLVQQFGWKDNQTAAIKNSITSGAQSDRFSSSTVAAKSLLGLSTGESGNVTIGDKSVAINLSTMSLTDIKNAINTAAPTGVTASVVSQTEGGSTYYRLQINGTQTFTDTKNILNTLGVLDHASADVAGKVSGNSMTTSGSFITASTLLKNIDGYTTFTAGGSPAGDYITLTGKDTANAVVNVNFNIASSTTVQDLLDQIKTSYGNVLAYVTSDGKIRVDDLSGGGYLQVNLADHIADTYSKLEFVTGDADFGAAAARKRQVVAGEDATVEVDGVSVTKTSNTINDVISGVTLNLLKEDASTTITLNVTRDIDAIKKKIQDYVTKYNEVSSYINTQLSYDIKANKAGGVLFGEGTISSVRSDLTSIITQSVWGVNSQYSIMGLIGINLDNKGQLSINDTTLTGYLRTNFNDVSALFAGQGVTSASTLAYSTHTRMTKAGEYTVHINTAATRSASTSNTDVGGTLGGSETLTITEGSKTSNISLTASMTIGDIINAVNTELSTVYTQKLAGSAQLKQDDNVTPITSETTWDNIYNTTLQNSDVISFSGTFRNGGSVTGSYTIGNVATDKVQGLLSAIENAFSSQVTATIDTSGRIIITDKNSGTSQLALDITEPVGRGLDFGTVLNTNTGGQTGRYALALSASNDGSNHLALTHNNYGGNYTFTISETSHLLWLTDQTVNNGINVAGTIGGEAATGSGQTLTGNAGNVNTDGLSLRYTGTSDNVDAGTIKVTVGTADLISRSLFNITDTYEGYLSFKQTSLQNSIDSYQTRITLMESQLDRKKEQMINRFVVMETALNKIRNQSNWLSAQTTAAADGWRL